MKSRIRELIDLLKKANEAYYANSQEIMSDKEYDALYDELVHLENMSGIVYADSPSQMVGYEAVDFLPKEEHATPMLSLGKTKSIDDLVAFTDRESILSWKLDGLTIVLTYEGGKLSKAVTRGNGLIGEVVTNNAQVFVNLPKQIPFQKKMVLRGEAVIRFDDFERINEMLPVETQYKNPRNLCSGTVRQLNNEITARRRVHFYAFTLVEATDKTFAKKNEQLEFLAENGFEVVPYRLVQPDNMQEMVDWFETEIPKNPFTTDGLVLTINDIAYSQSLGVTSKFPRDSIAFKWRDEIKETKLLEVEWSVSRTGLINPIAIFEPVDLEGTIVQRASLHNISILEDLELGIGDVIEVYKANMIIPQVAENHSRSKNVVIPNQCPVCEQPTILKNANGIKTLLCNNAFCPTKKIRSLEHFVSRNAMNIEGLSSATLEKFIQNHIITESYDIFRISKFEDIITEMEGFGNKSYRKLIQAIEKARDVELGNFIYALGIPNVGLSNAKLLAKSFENDLVKIQEAECSEIENIEGFGPIIALSVQDFFANQNNQCIVNELLKEINIINRSKNEQSISNENSFVFGKSFVITGSLNYYANRDELKKQIEDFGGKVTGSVTSKTDYLINNDSQSSSSKNKKAKELKVPIITEEEFRSKLFEEKK